MKKQAGQSTIEFIFTFAFGVSVILLIFNQAMNYATGYLVHYATFMASRTYLTADRHIGTFADTGASLNGAEERARAVFNQYNLSIFDIPATGFAINAPNAGNTAEYITVGARTIFDQRMDMIGRVAGQKKLELVSESFLGKEPTRATCASRVCKAITNQETCNSSQMDITLFDDGC
jgi:hypothetical protein